MSATPARRTTLAQRLKSLSPHAYSIIGPVARAVRRALFLAMSRFESETFITRLDRKDATDRTLRSPRVIIDGCAFQEPWGGIARVWSSILHEWAASGFAGNVLVVDRGGTAPRIDGFHYLAAPVLRAFDDPSQRRLLEAICSRYEADVFMSSGHTYPSAHRSVVLIHDMTPEVLGWNLDEPRWREKRHSIDAASAFICVSHNTESDLHRFYPASGANPSTVALNGVDPFFTPAPVQEVRALVARYRLPERYAIFMGHREGYKNAKLLFDALALTPGDPGVGVLLVGGAPVLEPSFAETAAALTISIVRLSDEELRAAYSGAVAMVYPSRYEGFGLPVIEAMACGCPVITCRNSSLPEVGGEVAIYVDESDPAELRAALQRVLDPSLRAALASEGVAWAANFRWSTSAELIQRVLTSAALSG